MSAPTLFRSEGLTDRMLENQRTKELLIFESMTGITIVGYNGNFTLGCDDGLEDSKTTRKFFRKYNELVDSINEIYNYKRLEEEYLEGDGQIFFNFDDYATYSYYR